MLFTKYAKYSSRRFCPVCKKNGKSETEYTSHNTRDTHDNPICPILLDIVCNYCGKNGHIAAKCQSKPSRDNIFVQETFLPSIPSKSNNALQSAPNNDFPSLLKSAPNNDFPSLLKSAPNSDFPSLLKSAPNNESPSLLKSAPNNALQQDNDNDNFTHLSYSNKASIAKQDVIINKKPKLWSPTCEEIESRLRKIVLADEYQKESVHNFSCGGTVYLTREQLRDKLNSGCDYIDTDKVYVIDDYIDDYDDPYDCMNNNAADDDNNDYDDNN